MRGRRHAGPAPRRSSPRGGVASCASGHAAAGGLRISPTWGGTKEPQSAQAPRFARAASSYCAQTLPHGSPPAASPPSGAAVRKRGECLRRRAMISTWGARRHAASRVSRRGRRRDDARACRRSRGANQGLDTAHRARRAPPLEAQADRVDRSHSTPNRGNGGGGPPPRSVHDRAYGGPSFDGADLSVDVARPPAPSWER
mmetsp:Transcript_12734/g.30352  ORF Transcript_12734/g.30352 Transcript_12734/m.30352 type:complete len:200 (-) Transcript_12734:207-806(-)